MVRIRAFEEKLKELYMAGRVRGLVHLSIGQEAVAAGVCTHLGNEDYLVSNHRGHGHLIAKGLDPPSMMAELFGREDGCCRGRGGSMHMGDLKKGILGANGIVGAGLPIAVGAALSARFRARGGISVVFFGDGAANQGTFHEAINLAAVLKMPVVFVCENNHYALSIPQSRHMAVTHVADRASAYGIPGAVVDGNDVCAVFEAAEEAILRARAGKGPFLLECKTYRWRGHGESDPSGGTKYRSAKEVKDWQKRCPIMQAESLLLREGAATKDVLARVRSEAQEEMESAVAFAEKSPWPDAADVLKFVYVDSEESSS
ncbi:MAG: thiamine pyrophosphate-dependent dehydrogenase E1 component subunit alpha [bacterium]|nr:thiamine pyrophosphate-dependent dehydrogenase E1 component subunit alpha [bacterium]